MSRSNPQEHAKNPAVRWFQWDGTKGQVRYYDKTTKANVIVPDFTFLLLDQLGSVGGWNDASDSAIYSNMVKDSREQAFLVKSFKGGILSEGLYKDIKDYVTSKSVGGSYIANLYLAFKLDGALAIGVLQFKGAALRSWMDFSRDHSGQLYTHALKVTGFTEGKKGSITFRVPTLAVVPVSDETQAQTVELDRTLQAWLAGYLTRTAHEPPEDEPERDDDHAQLEPVAAGGWDRPAAAITDDDIPF